MFRRMHVGISMELHKRTAYVSCVVGFPFPSYRVCGRQFGKAKTMTAADSARNANRDCKLPIPIPPHATSAIDRMAALRERINQTESARPKVLAVG